MAMLPRCPFPGLNVAPFARWAMLVILMTGDVVAAQAQPEVVVSDVPAPCSPIAIAALPDHRVAVVDRTGGSVAIVDARTQSVTRRIVIGGCPVAADWWPEGQRLIVADEAGADLVLVDPAGGVTRRWPVAARPSAVRVQPGANRAVVTHDGLDVLTVVDLRDGREVTRVSTGRAPVALALTPDGLIPVGKRAVVANLLPRGDARRAEHAAELTLVGLAGTDAATAITIPLPGGSTACRGVTVSPDGRWAYVVHRLGRPGLPTTHPDKGWIVTSALTIVDLQASAWYATVLLDRPTDGAADPWGIVVAPGGDAAWVSLAGAQELIWVDLARLHRALAGSPPMLPPGSDDEVWKAIKADPAQRRRLMEDLAALPAAGMVRRIPLPVAGPRGLAWVIGSDEQPHAGTVAVAGYFSGALHLVPVAEAASVKPPAADAPDSGKPPVTIAIGPAGSGATESGAARRGEALFHDARGSYQRWTSCASCHPGGARVDGMNWDLLNDGVGNPKNVRSLLLAQERHPLMSLQVREDLPTAVRAGFRFIEFTEPTPDQVADVIAYLSSLRPEPSPFLERSGGLPPAAQRGQALFTGKAACTTCHSGLYRSDGKAHDMGTITNTLDRGKKIATPMLVELWRTAPYLHDGSAPTLRDVLTTRNTTHAFGDAHLLTPAELDDLIAYLLSL